MKQVPAKLWDLVLQENQNVRNIAFAITVIQAMLVARQLFGAQGLSLYYPFTSVQTSQAITLALSRYMRPAEDESGEPDRAKLTQLVSEVCYMIVIL